MLLFKYRRLFGLEPRNTNSEMAESPGQTETSPVFKSSRFHARDVLCSSNEYFETVKRANS